MRGFCAAGGSLKVHDVGQYVASFVPSLAYFAKLDPRFRLSLETARSFSAYRGFGYAVFQLKESANESDFHPMAFRYTPADSKTLFFPTVHIHDGGSYRDRAEYSHYLYAQPEIAADRNWWSKSDLLPSKQLVEKSNGLVHPDRHLYKALVFGIHPNHDYILTSQYRLDTNLQTRNPVTA
jgi:hypothetical protein